MAKKPGIIVLSTDKDEVFNFMSDGWFDKRNSRTEKGQILMSMAMKCVELGLDVPDVIRLLQKAGFEIIRENDPNHLIDKVLFVDGTENS